MKKAFGQSKGRFGKTAAGDKRNKRREYPEDEYYGEEGIYSEDGEYYGEEVAYSEEGEYYGEEGIYSEEGEYYGEEGIYSEEGEYYEEEVAYSEDGEYYGEEVAYSEDGEYYGEEVAYSEEGEYYGEEGIYSEDGEYYGEEVAYSEDGEYYGEEAAYSEDGEYYEEESAYSGDGEYYGEEVAYSEDGEYYGEEGEYSEEGEYYEDGYSEEEYIPFSRGLRSEGKKSSAQNYATQSRLTQNRAAQTRPVRTRRDDGDFFTMVGRYLRSMDGMDKVMVFTGVAVLILALVTGGLFISSRMKDEQVSAFAEVGSQLEGIVTIGEAGIQAVAAAKIARLEGTFIEEEQPKQEDNKDYGENNYERQVSVEPHFTSIQKDLKIKFVNQKTDKLVANVPFSVVVTAPDGKNYIWSDDDMDGIIYKKDIAAGTYKVTMEQLADSKYSDYMVATAEKTTDVREEITYSKVDVSDEIKQESEINEAVEDTKKNEIEVESTIQDTVQWVESKVIPSTYNEVAKSTIPDPTTLVYAKALFLTGQNGGVEMEMPTPEPTPEPTQEPNVGTVSIATDSMTGIAGTTLNTYASVSGFEEGLPIAYSISGTDDKVAKATIDSSGNIKVEALSPGSVTFTVSVSYAVEGAQTEAVSAFRVTVGGKKAIALDKTATTVFLQNSRTIVATVTNALSTDVTVTAESSNTGVATVSVNKNQITVNGIAEGTANITVKYSESGEEVSAVCQVTVKKHPSEDKSTLLKDANGQQLYVIENNNYREATYADYYKAEKFFVRGDVKYTGWQMLENKMYFFDGSGKKVTGQQTIQGATYNFAEDGSLITGSGVVGIDVSKWNGTIDWDEVKNSGVSYVIIRCGYRGSSNGKLVVDSKFANNIKGATAAGLKIGIYFFSQAVDEIEAVEEASMVLEMIEGYNITYPIFLDVETSGGRGDKIDKSTRTAVCKAFCETIQNAGYKAGVYSNKLWLEKKLDAGALEEYVIWLAQYAASPTYGGDYDMWQYTATGNVNGINGDVDLNISYLGY